MTSGPSEARRSSSRDALAPIMQRSIQELRGNVAAIFGKLLQQRLVKKHVHLRRVIYVAAVVQLGREFLAFRKAGIHTQRLHQVDARMTPVQLLTSRRYDRVKLHGDGDGRRVDRLESPVVGT